MKPDNIHLSYRRSAIEGASPIGLVIALYDKLVSDIRTAGAAIRANDIEARCKELNHASWILGQLEDWVDKTDTSDLAQNLSSFYSHLRSKLTEAAVTKSASLLETQIELISQVRGAWQQRDTRSALEPALPAAVLAAPVVAAFAPQLERTAFSFSA